MKNKNGFTLIEMLGAVAILGMLSTVAIAGTSKYIASSRQKSYKMMSQSIYEATENCAVEGKCQLPGTITTDKLLEYGYLKNLKNPISKNADCTGKAVVTLKGTSQESLEYADYEYKVVLDCKGLEHVKEDFIWPNEKES